MKRFLYLLPIFFIVSGFSSTPKPEASYTDNLTASKITHPVDAAYLLSKKITNKRQKTREMVAIARKYLVINHFDAAKEIADALYEDNEVSAYLKIHQDMALQKVKMGLDTTALLDLNGLYNSKDKDYILEHVGVYYLSQKEFKKVENLIPQINHDLIASRLQLDLVKYYLEAGNITLAKDTHDRIYSTIEYDKASVYLAKYFIQTKQPETAINYVKSIQIESIRVDALQSLAVVFSENGFLDFAFKLLNAITDDSTYAKTLSKMSTAYAEQGNIDQAYQLADSITHTYYRDLSFSNISSVLATNQAFEDSLAVIKQIEQNQLFNKSLQQLAVACASAALYDLSFEMLALIKDPVFYQESLIKVASAFGSFPNYHYAHLLLKQIKDDTTRNLALTAFLKTFSTHQLYNKTATLLSSISTMNMAQDNALSTVANAYTSLGAFKEAVPLIFNIKTPSIKAISFGQLVEKIGATVNIYEIFEPFNTQLNRVAYLPNNPQLELQTWIHIATVFRAQSKSNVSTYLKYAIDAKKNIDPLMPQALINQQLFDAILTLEGLRSALDYLKTIDDLRLQSELLISIPPALFEDKKNLSLLKGFI